MSDQDLVQLKLKGTFKSLLYYSIFMSLGTLLAFTGFALGLVNSHTLPLVLVVGTVGGFPVLKAVLLGGMGQLTAPLKATYEVVTVDGAGNRVSGDGGAQSINFEFLQRLGFVALVFAIAPFLVFLYATVLSFRGFFLYLKARPKPAFIKSPPFIILMNWAVYIVSIGIMIGGFAARMAIVGSALANLQGQTLTVFTETANLRSEPSGTGKVIKILNTGDAVTATDNPSGFWVSVEAGGDKGFVYMSTLQFEKSNSIHLLKPDVEYPFIARVTDTITLMDMNFYNEIATLRRGSEAVVLYANNGYFEGKTMPYFEVEHHNLDLRIIRDDREQLEFVKTFTDYTERADFNRTMPFDATVTEDIEDIIRTGSGTVSIPAGATVTVTGTYNKGDKWSDMSRVYATYNGGQRAIYVKYLRPVNSTPAPSQPSGTSQTSTASAPAAELQQTAVSGITLTVVNETGYPIKELYIAAVGSGAWGNNLLDETFDEGSKAFQIPNTGNYDIKINYTDGDTFTKENISIMSNASVSFVSGDWQ